MAFNSEDAEFKTWLKSVALAGCERPEAACAALVLQPTADDRDRACWLSTLQGQGAARYAYETIRCGQYTLPHDAWKHLKAALRPNIAADKGQWFFHFFRQWERAQAPSALGDGGVDLLWGAELLDSLGPTANDYAFRFNLGSQLGACGMTPASIVLDWLNQRATRIKNGTPAL
jgi:hypothetical protein